jgi:hypothetical protein
LMLLETGFSRTDQDKLPDDTLVEDHDHGDEEEVDGEDPFNPPCPPPRWPHHDV